MRILEKVLIFLDEVLPCVLFSIAIGLLFIYPIRALIIALLFVGIRVGKRRT